MNTEKTLKPQRIYKQTVRAEAAAATAQTILDSFIKRLEEQWFEEITLDSIAKDSGVTVQTVIRRFGGKVGILESAFEYMEKAIHVRRSVRAGDIDFTVDVLAKDYEEVGDLILRLLNQEDRQSAIKPMVEQGRSGHREWLAEVFAPSLKPLTPARRKAKLDALVVATDIYVWKLVRRDMGRPVSAFKTIVKTMLTAALLAE
jgi:AcrR family transcriptional regulator